MADIYKWTTRVKTVNGHKIQEHVKVKMTSSEVKSYIMRVNNWTSEQYRKQYDLTKNKLRAYESYKSAQGGKVEQQSTVELLFKEARSKQLYGPNYTPSAKMRQIQSFSAYSITKGRQLATQDRYVKRVSKKYASYISTRFGSYDPVNPKNSTGFIGSNKGAQAIVKAFIDRANENNTDVNYVKLEEALSAYANKVHARINEKDEEEENSAIPVSSETYGSDDIVDFDYSIYL